MYIISYELCNQQEIQKEKKKESLKFEYHFQGLVSYNCNRKVSDWSQSFSEVLLFQAECVRTNVVRACEGGCSDH